jgi:hypothetical protein
MPDVIGQSAFHIDSTRLDNIDVSFTIRKHIGQDAHWGVRHNLLLIHSSGRIAEFHSLHVSLFT